MMTRTFDNPLGTLAKLLALFVVLSLTAVACGADTNVDTTLTDEPSDEEVIEEEVAEEEEEAMEEETTEEVEAEEGTDSEIRIVSMSPTATEMLFAIGAGDLVIAADNNSNFPAEAPTNAELTSFPVNVEGIISLAPTHVATTAPIEGLADVGIAEIILPFAATFDDTYAQIEQLGAATGHVGEAAELVVQMQTDIAAIVDTTEVPDAGFTYYHELDNTLFSATSSTFVGQVYALFGLENVADAADPDGESFGFPQLSEEFLVTADPDLIFLADTICCDQSAETVAARPGWDALSAVTNGNVVELNDDVASRWGPRLVDYVQAISDALTAANVPVAN